VPTRNRSSTRSTSLRVVSIAMTDSLLNSGIGATILRSSQGRLSETSVFTSSGKPVHPLIGPVFLIRGVSDLPFWSCKCHVVGGCRPSVGSSA
jgi:hypothetical protein